MGERETAKFDKAFCKYLSEPRGGGVLSGDIKFKGKIVTADQILQAYINLRKHTSYSPNNLFDVFVSFVRERNATNEEALRVAFAMARAFPVDEDLQL